MKKRPPAFGFTLIELSIVLVVLGLVVGAVVGGKTLVHQARLQAVIRDWKHFHGAINAFRSQYLYLPGDFPNAYDYWGPQPLCPQDLADEDDGCNGNGNGILGDLPYQGVYEPLVAWHHMVWAEILEPSTVRLGGPGNLAGYRWRQVSTNPEGEVYPGVGIFGNSVPLSSLHEWVGYFLLSAQMDNNWSPPEIYGKSGIWIMMIRPDGGLQTTQSGMFGSGAGDGAATTPLNASLLDKKIDDGKPATGSVTASRWWAGAGPHGNCTNPNITPNNMDTATNLSAVTYLLTNTGFACNPMFYYGE